ncbi:41654_t:CDS:1, partial [Gigaspora margarita]
QKVWKLALELATPSAKLRIPEHWNDLFSDHYTGNIKLRNWININAMYEIWCQYTQAKWGNPIPSPVIDLVIKYRLEKMVKTIKCIGKRGGNGVKGIIKDLK